MTGVAKVLLSPVGAALGVFKKPKPVTPAVPLPTATPRANSVLMDTLSARRGASANQRTGSRGVESTTAAKKTLLGS